MTIVLSGQRIKSTKDGWVVQTKKGEQWKNPKYFTSTKSASEYFVSANFQYLTNTFRYIASSEDGAFYLLKELDLRLKSVCEQIVQVLNG